MTRLHEAEGLLIEFRDRLKFREPDSDYMEYCKGCHRSPYNKPPHKEDCIVPRLLKFLEGK